MRKYYLDEMIKVLESPIATRLNFSAYGININGQEFKQLAQDLKQGFTVSPPNYSMEQSTLIAKFVPRLLWAKHPTNLVILTKDQGNTSAVYDRLQNVFIFNLRVSPIHPQWGCTVVHEAVHALLDMKYIIPPSGTEEPIAYIAEHIYGVHSGMQLETQKAGARLPDTHSYARLTARAILTGKPYKSFLDDLLKIFRKEVE